MSKRWSAYASDLRKVLGMDTPVAADALNAKKASLHCDCQEWVADKQLLKEIEAGFKFTCPKFSQGITVREVSRV